MRNRGCSVPVLRFLLTLAMALCGSGLQGGTVVISNRTSDVVLLQEAKTRHRILPGENLSLRSDVSLTVRFSQSVQPHYKVDPNAIYFLAADGPHRVELHRIGVGGDAVSTHLFESDLLLPQEAEGMRETKPLVIPVKILADDDEAATRAAWEERLRARVAKASAIFEKHCFVRFDVVAVETWESNDAISDFELSFADFERRVDAKPARLAIGFTSQYRVITGRTHLGGTRGPLHSHMLVREWSNRISESEKLEVLVHELGHFLGAVHSPENTSVMRAILGDKQARAQEFRIGFDPINTMALCLVSEAMQSSRVRRLEDLRLPYQLELSKLYVEMAKADSRDPAAKQYAALLERASIFPLTQGTRFIVAQIRMRAEGFAVAAADNPQSPAVDGDSLASEYVRHAAACASRMADSVGRCAFLLGLGIGLDRTSALSEHRLIGPLVPRIEDSEHARARLKTLGVPLAYGKHELARHFFLGAALTSVVGADAAEHACLALQLRDAEHGEFNPAAYQANLSGIVFGYRVLVGELRLAALASQFQMATHLPIPEAMQEAVSASEFADQYGSIKDPRFLALRASISKRIRELIASQSS